jgi:hypothetical protein
VGPCNRGQYENGEKVDEVKSHEDSSAFGRGSYMTVGWGIRKMLLCKIGRRDVRTSHVID